MLSNRVRPCSIVRVAPWTCRPPVRRRRGLVAADQRAAGEDEVEVADRHHVALVQRRRLDADAVDEGAVDGAGVPDLHDARRSARAWRDVVRPGHRRRRCRCRRCGRPRSFLAWSLGDAAVSVSVRVHDRGIARGWGSELAAGTPGWVARCPCRSGRRRKSVGGPPGSPMLMVCPSVIATDDMRRPPTNMPLRLPLSIATQRPSTKRMIRCARETSGLTMRMSACGSRPTTMSRPGSNVRCDEIRSEVRNGSRTIATGKTSVSSDGGGRFQARYQAVGNSCVFGMRRMTSL